MCCWDDVIIFWNKINVGWKVGILNESCDVYVWKLEYMRDLNYTMRCELDVIKMKEVQSCKSEFGFHKLSFMKYGSKSEIEWE